MQIELSDIFLSTEVWGLIGPFAIVAVGFVITANRKYRGLGIFWVIVEMVMIAQYFNLVSAIPFYWWNIILLILGVLATGAQMAGR